MLFRLLESQFNLLPTTKHVCTRSSVDELRMLQDYICNSNIIQINMYNWCFCLLEIHHIKEKPA